MDVLLKVMLTLETISLGNEIIKIYLDYLIVV